MLFIVSVIVCAGSILVLGVSYYRVMKQTQYQEQMQELVNQIVTQETEETTITEDSGMETETEEIDILEQLGIIVPEKNLEWDVLHEECADIYAWITVDGTGVDYPIVQHPTDNEYYLTYNMDGTKGFPGCVFTEDYNSRDFSDIHTVIYGHTWRKGTMFSSLHDLTDEEVFSQDHYIYVYTEDYVFVYKIFAVYEFPAIHLLDNYDLENEYVYADYLRGIYEADGRIKNIRYDIPVGIEDQIVTLSTCTSDHDAELRYLVTGVLVNPRK